MMSKKDRLRFWSKVSVPGLFDSNSCWKWNGSMHKDGYGHIKIKGKMLLAHRISWMLIRSDEDITSGLEIDHLCKNRDCVNPFHMELVTHRVNILRGNSPQAQNARKTHCARGHLLAGENIRPFPKDRGGRICRRCLYDRNKARLEAKRARH